MHTRTKQDAVYEKRNALDAADAAGEVADSMEVRKQLIDQMNRGEKTLAEIQAELAKIKRNAKKEREAYTNPGLESRLTRRANDYELCQKQY